MISVSLLDTPGFVKLVQANIIFHMVTKDHKTA